MEGLGVAGIDTHSAMKAAIRSATSWERKSCSLDLRRLGLRSTLNPVTRKIRLLSHRPDHERRRLLRTQVSSTNLRLATLA